MLRERGELHDHLRANRRSSDLLVHAGREGQPWLGYGIGYESISLKIKTSGREGSVGASGPEFGHFMFGVDFRITSGFGVGPFFDLAVGQYSTVSADAGTSSQSNEISNKGTHEWLIFGPRFVFFP